MTTKWVKRRRARRIELAVFLVALAVFCYSGWRLFGIWREYKKGTDTYDNLASEAEKILSAPDEETPAADGNSQAEAENDPKAVSLYALMHGQNPDYVGWITIPDTKIDYPIVQCSDNDHYLKHTFGQEENAAGTLFVDSNITDGMDARHVIIYGAGVIGCEYASIFRGMEVKVDLINTRDRLLAFLDQEMSDSLSYHFWNSGVVIRHNEEYEKIEGCDDGVIMHLKSGKKLKADCLLYANGRTGNTDSLQLENIGLETDSRGQLKVNSMYQTALPHVYAVGDVIGYPSLASAAYDQGRIAAQALVKGEATAHLIEDIPTGIYTIPEISSVGKTEQQLTAMKVPYEVGRAQFKHLARAQIVGMSVGTLKILFHRETKEILGIHCFGERAAEIIHIGQAIMEQKGGGNTIEYFVNTTFNYPTMAEAYRVAALNGLNRLF